MTGQGSRFTHINEHFCCENCGKDVAPVKTGCRNHCPHCLVSKHVDVFPGDRDSECHGMMDPMGYELDGKKGLVLRFKCRRCGAETRNIAAHEDPGMPDDYDKILRLGRAP